MKPRSTGPAAVPRWRRIADALAQRIAGGDFPPGTRLPGEQRLADEYAVNRHTLRRATKALEASGHLTIRRGSGAYARKLVIDYPLTRRTRLSRNLAASGDVAARELIDVATRIAGPWAAPLELPGGAPIEWLRTRSSVRGWPLCIAESAYPSPRFKGIADRYATARSVSAALAAFGVADYIRRSSVVAARLPTAEEADWLERAQTAPVLVVDSVNVDPAGVPIEAARTVFAADAIQFVVNTE
ncbi:MAG: phosphonate metabolism transcriptional regulator PhnF [Lautropia sp.]